MVTFAEVHLARTLLEVLARIEKLEQRVKDLVEAVPLASLLEQQARDLAEFNARRRHTLGMALVEANLAYGNACMAYVLNPSEQNARRRDDFRMAWKAARDELAIFDNPDY